MHLRRAETRDSDDLLAWRNDPKARAASRNTARVEPADHDRWLTGVLADPSRIMLVAENAGGKIGTVRFDPLTDGWEVNINVAPERRGQGLGGALLGQAMRRLHAEHPGAKVIAYVRADNAPSLSLFEAAGFRLVSEENGLKRLEHG